MSLSPLALAPIALAVVLVVAAVGKLRSPASAAAAFVDLNVPNAFRRRWIVRGHPWFELVLALALLGAVGVALIVIAAVTLALFAGYLALIVRAVRRDEAVSCDCFGASSAPITAVTVARNVGYLVLAAAALVLGVAGGGVPRTIIGLSGVGWLWLIGAAAVAAVAVLTVAASLPRSLPPTRASSETTGSAHQPEDDEAERDEAELDYVRLPTPAVPLERPGGEFVTLRELSKKRAQLLLFVSATCGWCQQVEAAAPGWAAEVPQIDVRLVRTRSAPPGDAGETTDLFDRKLWAYETLQMQGVPGAVLLGMDGLLAGGPVTGAEDIADFVAAIKGQLDEASEAG